MKTYKVTIQVSESKFETIEVIALSAREASLKARINIKGVVVAVN